MMSPDLTLAIALTALVALGVVAFTTLRGFGAWLDWKRTELAAIRSDSSPPPTTIARIEVADLKERIRKLEAIAAGVEL